MTTVVFSEISNSLSANNSKLTEDHFGGVIVNSASIDTFDHIGFDNETIQAIKDLNLTTIRYPGGTEAEQKIDWSSGQNMPDRPIKLDQIKGAIDVCAELNLKFSFTFPVKEFVSKGVTDLEKQQISSFIKEIADYTILKNVSFDSLKVGNEYNVGADRINAKEYGIVASELSPTIGTTLVTAFTNSTQEKPSVLIESGASWHYQRPSNPENPYDHDDNGVADYSEIMEEFSTVEASYIDGIDIHNLTLDLTYTEALPGTSKSYVYGGENSAEGGSALSSNGNYQYGSQYQLTQLISHWNNATGGFSNIDLEFHTLAWSLPNNDTSNSEKDSLDNTGSQGASLANAPLLFLQMHNFSSLGLDSSFYWTPLNAAAKITNAFVFASNNNNSQVYRPAGEVFAVMQEQLLGFTAIEFDTDPSVGSTLVRGFQNDEDETVLYIANLSSDNDTITLDSKNILSVLKGDGNIDDINAIMFDATTPSIALDPNAQIIVTQLDGMQMLDESSGTLNFTLNGHGMIQLTLVDKAESNNIIHGTSKTDNLNGTNGNDVIYTYEGNDSVKAGKGDDQIIATSGKNVLNGQDGNDKIIGGSIRDIIIGGKGNDEIHGNNGWDQLNGWAGDDLIFGGNGGDQLGGQQGDDTLNGGNGKDRLSGGSGDDIIFGGKDWDRMWGGSGQDTFVFGEKDGWRDYIKDFELGIDLINLSNTSKTNFSQLNISNKQDASGNDGAVINYGTGSIFLLGVEVSQLKSNYFDFS